VPQDKARNHRNRSVFWAVAASLLPFALTACARVNIDPEGPFNVDIGSTKEKIDESRGAGSIGNAKIFAGFRDSDQTSVTSRSNQPPKVIFSYPKKLESPPNLTVAVMATNREQPVQLDVYTAHKTTGLAPWM